MVLAHDISLSLSFSLLRLFLPLPLPTQHVPEMFRVAQARGTMLLRPADRSSTSHASAARQQLEQAFAHKKKRSRGKENGSELQSSKPRSFLPRLQPCQVGLTAKSF